MQSSVLALSTPVYPGAHNEHRPHRSLEQRPPLAKPPPAERAPPANIGRRDRLSGLIHEYYAIAA
jgi:putative transposase